MVNSEHAEEGKPAVVWAYSVGMVYKGTDYSRFDLDYGDRDEPNSFVLDRQNLTLDLSVPSSPFPLKFEFQCEIMDDSAVDQFLRDRQDRLNEIESNNQI